MSYADGDEATTSPGMAMALTTDYEQDRQEIEELMLRFLPHYMEDLQRCLLDTSIPVTERKTKIVNPKRDVKPFDIADYDIHKFRCV